MSRSRVLFVDDELNIRLTLPVILNMHGFEVTAAGTVREALAAINSKTFDVLIADLNIGQPGDGFTVVSAMRRTQPQAVTIIMTGFPAFETALQAIRSQVDDYVVKPASVPQLLEIIHGRLAHPAAAHQSPLKRVAHVVRENQSRIYELWLSHCTKDPILGAVQLTDRERSDHVPNIIAELADMLARDSNHVNNSGNGAGAEHGRERHAQGFTAAMLLREISILRHVVYAVVQENLLAIDISYVISEMTNISDNLDQQLGSALETYLELEKSRNAA